MTSQEAPGPRDIAVVAYARTGHRRSPEESSEVEMLMPVLHEVLAQTGLRTADIGFTCSGSSDYLAGRAFSFTLALDGVGAWPPISESHVEMDGAWALYEAWTKLLTGDADTALVYSYGKCSPGSVRDVLTRQLDPYYVAPLWPDAVALAALQAQALIDVGHTDETALAAVCARSRADADAHPRARLTEGAPQGDYVVRPLRTGDCPPVGDGAAAVILAAGERARELCARPAWIRGIDHRIEAHGLGVRDLTDSPSARLAAHKAGAFERPVDTAELHAPFSSQEVILRQALGLDDDVCVNPSGGALAANPVMAAGLIRIGEAAARIHRGASDRALAHATSGPCLQQNLVAVLEGDPR
ncbi:thiolase domain-containing protein [Streptomyces sp. NPDC014636]|uniref:thiolase domain-containing protein n=1 Tax=Streptomyces sp. NPDC014636 TaxID=3364876 RepID=UPI0036F70A3A